MLAIILLLFWLFYILFCDSPCMLAVARAAASADVEDVAQLFDC